MHVSNKQEPHEQNLRYSNVDGQQFQNRFIISLNYLDPLSINHAWPQNLKLVTTIIVMRKSFLTTLNT